MLFFLLLIETGILKMCTRCFIRECISLLSKTKTRKRNQPITSINITNDTFLPFNFSYIFTHIQHTIMYLFSFFLYSLCGCNKNIPAIEYICPKNWMLLFYKSNLGGKKGSMHVSFVLFRKKIFFFMFLSFFTLLQHISFSVEMKRILYFKNN